jgi:diacylglycerol kinase
MASREKQYVITMAFRMVCFISIFFVDGWLRWVVLAGAVFLPFIAVLFANQANEKTVATAVHGAEPLPATALTVGAPVPEVIEGELDEDDGEGWSRGERVA